MGNITVTCGDLETNWQPLQLKKIQNSVDLWRIQLPDSLQIPNKFEAKLNLEEKQTASRFYHQKDRQNFVIRRAVLRILLGDYLKMDALKIEFSQGKNKKPRMSAIGREELFFNVSHSGKYILIGLSDSEIGVDIEYLVQGFNFQDIAMQTFSEFELRFIDSSRDPERSFFQLWTRKEALTKGSSKGLDDDLVHIPVLDGQHIISSELLDSSDDWVVKSFNIDDTYSASLATLASTSYVNFANFPITNYL